MARLANDLTLVVDSVSKAQHVAGQRAEVGHHAVLPEESVLGLISGKV